MKIKEIRKRAGCSAGPLLLAAGYPSKEAIRTAASLGADLVSERAPALVEALDAHIAVLRALRKDVSKLAGHETGHGIPKTSRKSRESDAPTE